MEGAVIVCSPPEVVPAVAAEPVDFDVLYEDREVIVIDKPAGIVVHPGSGHELGTLAAGLLNRFPELEGVGDEGRWGIVHRLDKETSGVLMVARTERAHAALRRALQRREVGRRYLALVLGVLRIPTGTVDAPIGRDPRRPTRMAVVRDGRPARTHYERMAEWVGADRSLLAVRLETGRTHQIRIHLASIGHPVAGDRAYGGRSTTSRPGRMWLHAAELGFAHPGTGKQVVIRAPLPEALRTSLTELGPPTSGNIPPS